MSRKQGKVGGRLSGPTDPRIVEMIYEENLRGEFPATFSYILEINRAHTIALLRSGVIDISVARSLLQALDKMETEGASRIRIDPSLEESYFNHEAWIIQQIGMENAGQLHTARSRNDLGATVDRLRARDKLIFVLRAQLNFRRSLLKRANETAEFVMPGYTHMQQAQPITFGYYLAAIATAAGRDYRRLLAALDGNDFCPLGAAALSGSGFKLDCETTAAHLGFPRQFSNGLDAVTARDFLMEAAQAASLAAVTCSRMAQDLHTFITDEFSLIDVDDSVSGTSSIMPQKKNPFLFEYLRGSSSRIVAACNASVSGLSGKNYTIAIDTIREDLRGAWDALEMYGNCVELATIAVNSTQPRADIMLDRARGSFATVTDLADTLVQKAGLSFREAHHIVGQVVRMSIERGISVSQIGPELLDEASKDVLGRAIKLTESEVSLSLDPMHAVNLRNGMGQTAPESVRASVAEALAACEDDASALNDVEATIQGRKAQLCAAVASVLGEE